MVSNSDDGVVIRGIGQLVVIVLQTSIHRSDLRFCMEDDTYIALRSSSRCSNRHNRHNGHNVSIVIIVTMVTTFQSS